MFLCHSQTKQMATAVIFMEVPEWLWHYDPALDSLVLVAHSNFRLYILFHRLFSVLVVSWHFDHRRPYADSPLRLAHPLYFPKPAPFASSMETDPSEGSSPHPVVHVAESDSSSVGTKVLLEMQLEEDPEELVLENGFHTP